MRRVPIMLLLASAAFLPATVVAQNASNPVTEAARSMLSSHQKNLVAAAEEMPEGKYGFKPTPQQMSFRELVAHIGKSNDGLCSKLSSQPAPAIGTSQAKTELVSELRQSFEFCSNALNKLNDSELNQQVPLWGGMKATKAAALFYLTSDWADHYAAAAMYLRLNGMLPPTAKHKE